MNHKKGDLITHVGVVENVSMPHVYVRIMQSSACSACSAARLCHSSESKEKVLEAWVSDGCAPQVGDTVKVVGHVNQGLLATLLAYVVPLVLVVALLFALSGVLGEGLVALVALASLVPWYGLLWLLRGKLAQKLGFIVESNQIITNN